MILDRKPNHSNKYSGNKKLFCTYCKKTNHYESNCYAKQRDLNEKQGGPLNTNENNNKKRYLNEEDTTRDSATRGAAKIMRLDSIGSTTKPSSENS